MGRQTIFRRVVPAVVFSLTLGLLVHHFHGPQSTNLWQSLSSHPPPPPPKLSAEELAGLSLDEKLRHIFPYSVGGLFPAYIWQTWKTTPAHDTFEFRLQEQSWTHEHPGFVHEVITDGAAVHLLRVLFANAPEVVEAYEALPSTVQRADLFRYAVLLARGGIYSDIDTRVLRSALVWIPKAVPRESVGLVVGIEADPDRPDWAKWYSRRIQICQWTIQAKPGHPVLRNAVSRLVTQTLDAKRNGTLSTIAEHQGEDTVEFSGPALWTDVIFDYFNDPRFFGTKETRGNVSWRNLTRMENARLLGDVVVLPITSFSPGIGHMGSKDDRDPMAFVKHDFRGSWKLKNENDI